MEVGNANSVPQSTWDQLGVPRESLTRLEILVGLVRQWQAHINLISPSTLPDIWTRHVLDSAQLLPLIHGNTEAIADLGSGGGFPALVLAATHTAKIHIHESNAKKVSFLQEVLRQMKVEGFVHRERLEPRVAPIGMPKVQLVTARAFAPLDLLLGYAEPFAARCLFHKGQDVDAELTEAAKSWKISVRKHLSITDSRSVILDVTEIFHV